MREPRWYESDEPDPAWLGSPLRPRAFDRRLVSEAWHEGRWRHEGLGRALHAQRLPDGVALFASAEGRHRDVASGWLGWPDQLPFASAGRRAEVLDAALRDLPYPLLLDAPDDGPPFDPFAEQEAPAVPPWRSRAATMTIRIAPTIRVEVEGDATVLAGFVRVEHRPLALQCGRVFHGAKGDLLGSSLGGLLEVMKRAPRDELGGSRPGHRRALEMLFARLAVHLGELVRPDVRAVIFRFAPSLRRALHDLLVTDETGRVWQATQSLPGVVALAAAAGLSNKPRTQAVLVEGLRQGRKARPLVEEAIQTLGLERKEQFAAHWAWPRELEVIDRTFARYARELRERLSRPELHAAFVLRAPAMTPAWALLQPPPAALTVDHLPRGRTQLWCYLTALRLCHALESDIRVDPARVAAAARWLARNRVLRQYEQALVEYLVRGLSLSPKSAPAPVRRRLELLTLELAAERRRLFAQGPNLVPAGLPWEAVIRALEAQPLRPLAPAPLPAATHGDDWIAPIRDTHELAAEARLQQHCVATFADAAIHGHSFLYRGEVAGFRFTLELGRTAAGPVLRQLYGKRNSRPPPAAERAVQRWLTSRSLAEVEGERERGRATALRIPWPPGFPR